MKYRAFRRLWGMPLLLAFLILFGLPAALLGVGIWHILSWIALSVPILVIIRYAFRSPRSSLNATAGTT